MPEQNRDPLRIIRLLIVACAVLLLDQGSKSVVSAAIPGETYVGWPAVKIALTRNYGGVFGLFPDAGRQLLIVGVVVVLMLVLLALRGAGGSLVTDVALALAIGGAAGNLLDRARLGYVRDFIHVGPWPAFNAADAVIVAAVCLFILAALRRRGAQES
jgi:signal peptidase II